MRIIKLMPDYFCFPLWEASPGMVGNIDPKTLPISIELREQLMRWAGLYDQGLDMDDPKNSVAMTEAELEAFELEGRKLGKDLQDELGPDFLVVFRK